MKTTSHCSGIRWTTGDRLLVPQIKKCLGVQGKSVGSEVGLYICNENDELQKWECKNDTLLALKGQELYIELTADNTAVLSRATGPNNHLTILGTSKGACTRTYRGTVQYATYFSFYQSARYTLLFKIGDLKILKVLMQHLPSSSNALYEL